MILKQLDEFSANLEPLKSLQQNFRRMDMDTQKTLKQVVIECENQNELLRLLIANSLIDDVSRTLREDKQIIKHEC